MSSDGVDQDGKHKQPIEAPETLAPSDYTKSLGLRSQESLQVAAGLKQVVMGKTVHFSDSNH